MEPKVCAVVVTHNRLALLRECLSALEAQTRRPDRVLLVDNASTDGTGDALRAEFPAVELVSLPDNRGGAGGFQAGLEAAQAGEEEWFWLMDDDTIARSDALAALLAASAAIADLPPAPVLLASRVVWRDGRLHPMNTPGLRAQRCGPLGRERSTRPAAAGDHVRIAPGPAGGHRTPRTTAGTLLHLERRPRVHGADTAPRSRML